MKPIAALQSLPDIKGDKRFIPLLVPLKGQPHWRDCIAFDTETQGTKNEFQCGVVSTPQGEIAYTLDDSSFPGFMRGTGGASGMLDCLTHKRYLDHGKYATNLSFDIFVLFQAVAGPGAMPKDWEIFDNGSRLIWVRKTIQDATHQDASRGVKHHKKYATFMDSLNLFPLGVEAMGNVLQRVSKTFRKQGDTAKADYYNVGKLKPPGCNCKPENEDHEDCTSWLGKRKWQRLSEAEKFEQITYCAMDAITTRKFMEWFGEEIVNLGATVRMTAASTAMDLFRRRYMREENLCIPQPHWECLVDSRLSYYGGRTEDFVKGTVKQVWDYDVASMYPASMTEIQFPYPSPERFIKRNDPSLKDLEAEGFSKVTIRVPKSHVPPLPYRSGPKLLFPWGILTGVWTNLELRYALEQGCVIEKISWTYTSHKSFNPFLGYVHDLYRKRLTYAYPANCTEADCKHHALGVIEGKCASSMATEEVVKLFLNGLYGKFAQNFLTEQESAELGVKSKKSGGIFKPIIEASMDEILFTGREYPDYLAKGYVINKSAPKLKRFMNPILSAYVTARARVKLHQFIMLAIKEGAEVLYTDTDSLYVTKPLSFATREKILGELQVGKPWKEILIVGPKSKRLVGLDGKKHNTAKGVPKKSFLVQDSESMISRKVKPRDDLFDSMEGDTLTTRYSRFMRMKEALVRGLLPNEIVPIAKTFDPFAFPKRRILGKPTIRDLLYGAYQTEPWEIDTDGNIIGEEEA